VPVGLALIGLTLTGCSGPSSSQTSAPALAQPARIGLVTGLLGLDLSDGPSEPVARSSASNLGLVLDTQQVSGVTWRRLAVADGSIGWTSHPFEDVQLVSAQPFLRPFSLLEKSPDDPDFGDAREIRVRDDATGEIVSASRAARVGGNEQLMLPERFRRSLPWLQLKFGSAVGFAPFDWIVLSGNPRPPAATLEEALDAMAVKGIVWRPFLGTVAAMSALTRVAPRRVYELEDAGAAPSRAQTSAEWSVLDLVYRDERGLVALYADGAKRLFLLKRESEAPIHLLVNADHATVAHVRHSDLNNDERDEWVLEVVGRYGDGSYSVLWIVDGRSTPESLMLQQLPLSRSGGEAPGKDVDRSWSVRPDSIIEVVSTAAGEKQSLTYRYGDRLTRIK
jgi:hypothetical protein